MDFSFYILVSRSAEPAKTFSLAWPSQATADIFCGILQINLGQINRIMKEQETSSNELLLYVCRESANQKIFSNDNSNVIGFMKCFLNFFQIQVGIFCDGSKKA